MAFIICVCIMYPDEFNKYLRFLKLVIWFKITHLLCIINDENAN